MEAFIEEIEAIEELLQRGIALRPDLIEVLEADEFLAVGADLGGLVFDVDYAIGLISELLNWVEIHVCV